MAMACKVHSLFIQELQVVCAWIVFVDELTALEHTIRESFVVATANHEYTWLLNTHLNHLEIVRKVAFEIYELVHAGFVFHVVYWYSARVFLEHVELRREFHWQTGNYAALAYLGTRSVCSDELLLLSEPSILSWLYRLETWVLFGQILSRPSFFLNFLDSFTVLYVLQQLAISVTLLAAWTFEFENIHKVFELNIDLDGPVGLMAHRTF